RPWKRPASLRLAGLFACGPTAWPASKRRLPLDLGPGVHPIVVVLADVPAVVAAVGHRRLPVVDALPERGVARVVLVAELRVRRHADRLRRRDQRLRVARLALRR